LSSGQLKSQPGYSFSKLRIFFKADVYEREKSITFNQHTIVLDVFVLFHEGIFRVKTTMIIILFFYGVAQMGTWLRSPGAVRNYLP
jgi:hypothetical protein